MQFEYPDVRCITIKSPFILYFQVLRRDLVQALRKKGPYLAVNIEQVILHQDNTPAHTIKTSLEIDLLGFECLKHPPYGPNLAQNGFCGIPAFQIFSPWTMVRRFT